MPKKKKTTNPAVSVRAVGIPTLDPMRDDSKRTKRQLRREKSAASGYCSCGRKATVTIPAAGGIKRKCMQCLTRGKK